MSNSTGEKVIVKGACPHDCPDTCSMLITVEDGPQAILPYSYLGTEGILNPTGGYYV